MYAQLMLEIVKMEDGAVAIYRAGGPAVLVVSVAEIDALERALAEVKKCQDD